ncbi:MAG: chitobiase/beta-hexosaminidase C-terminal domain-containing protein, partial [Deltaproteobacteria bacterium]|nr:chitobiase/beta-hexosaminidase C-terminal domain-containing protein [Deltaproteobacteria bacterium]
MRALVCIVALVHTGCTALECAEGTFSDGDKCVGYDPNDHTPPVTTPTPAGGRTREPIPKIVTLTTNESARIYHTTDGTDPDPATQAGESSPAAVVGVQQGTTLKYFAIDRAGNREQLVTTTFDSDTQAPAPVAAMSLTLAGTVPTVTWTNPGDADFAGVVIVRAIDAIDSDPVPGKLYMAPSALSPTLQVVSVSKATSFTDAARPAGPVRYVAYTFDDVGNYSRAVFVRDEIALGSTAAQLTWSNNTLATPTSPANLALTGTTATLAGTTLTIALSVTNNTSRYFQNLKAEIASVTNAAFANPDGTADGLAFG